MRPSLFRVAFIRPIEALAANQIAWLSGVSHSREAKKRAARRSGKSGRYIAKREEDGEREEGGMVKVARGRHGRARVLFGLWRE